MYSTKKITSSKKWPSFLKKSPITKRKTIEKAFAKVGLRNCSGDSDITVNEYYSDFECKPVKCKIVLSARPWDIATMSQRGISSCQSWNESHRCNLIGSIMDPYTAIIYATDGEKTKHGKRMVARSVVRLVYSNKTKRMAVYIDAPYTEEDCVEHILHSAQYREEFREFIAKRVKKGVEVIAKDSYAMEHKAYFIPMSKAVLDLDEEDQRSYRDTWFPYRKIERKKLFGKK